MVRHSAHAVDLKSLQIDRSKTPRQRRGRGNPWPLRLAAVALLGAAAYLFWPALQSFADRVRLPVVRTTVVRPSAPAFSHPRY